MNKWQLVNLALYPWRQLYQLYVALGKGVVHVAYALLVMRNNSMTIYYKLVQQVNIRECIIKGYLSYYINKSEGTNLAIPGPR